MYILPGKAFDLVLHERDERTDYEGETPALEGQHVGRQLVAERLARAWTGELCRVGCLRQPVDQQQFAEVAPEWECRRTCPLSLHTSGLHDKS